MKTIAFIVPFKSKNKSRNWDFDCALLNRTLRSLLNQTNKSYSAYVVYTDLPNEPVQNEKIKWIRFPFEFVRLQEMTDRDTFIKTHGLEGWAEGCFDQGKRVLYGSKFAKADGCKYIMSLDADDLISSRFVENIVKLADSGEFGWYVEKGYNYTEGKNFLIRVPHKMNFINGSVNVVRADLVPEPDFREERLENFNFFPSHAYLRNRIWHLYGKPLQPLPFYAIVYVKHGFNWVNGHKRTELLSIKEIVKSIIRFRYITPNLRKEFNISKLTA